MNLKEALNRKLSRKELSLLPRGFGVIGSIAIVNLPLPLRRKGKVIGAELLKLKNIQTVVNKVGEVKGKLRKTSFKIIAGERTFETLHKESGCRFRLDISKMYFSPRLSEDRLEIARQVKKGEKVIVMFAGILPYPIIIAKHSKAKEVWAIELNKAAAKYAEENIKLNKVKVNFIQGDVKKVVPKLKKEKFDRIVMTRPQIKETFLKEAFSLARKGTIVHFHGFLSEEEIPMVAIEKIKEAAKKAKRKVKILRWKVIGELAPYKYRARIDFKIL